MLALGILLLAAPDKMACIDAHAEGQRLRMRAQLTEARQRFLLCSQESCPAVAKDDCTAWLRDVEARIPTVILTVRSPRGDDLPAKVTVDGTPAKLDGTALALNPGPRALRAEAAGYRTAERNIVVREGEKDRAVAIVLEPIAAAPPPKPRELRPVTWISAGVAALAAGAVPNFAIKGLSDENALSDRCAPTCSKDQVGSVRTSYVAADVALGVAVLAGGFAVITSF
jgi:hypothetical protein